jgi:hypothetical protein
MENEVRAHRDGAWRGLSFLRAERPGEEKTAMPIFSINLVVLREPVSFPSNVP